MKYVLTILLMILISCGGLKNKHTDIPETNCTVLSLEGGALITCDDGSEVLITDGNNGEDGKDGLDGKDGADAEEEKDDNHHEHHDHNHEHHED